MLQDFTGHRNGGAQMRAHPQSRMYISEQTKSSSHENAEQGCPQSADDSAKAQVGENNLEQLPE